MDVRAVSRAVTPSNNSLAPGSLTWATVEDVNNKHSAGIRAVALVGNQLYTSNRKGVRKWSTIDARCISIVPSSIHLAKEADLLRIICGAFAKEGEKERVLDWKKGV